MEKAKVVRPEDINWEAHPNVPGLKSAFLITNKEDGTDLTCMFTYIPPGAKVKEHTHEFDEIIYVVKGNAMMHLEDLGEKEVIEGSFIRIPKGVKHYIYKLEEEFIAYNVFYPFMK